MTVGMMDFGQRFQREKYGPRQLLLLLSLSDGPKKYAELVIIHQQARSNVTTHTKKLAAYGLICVDVVENPDPRPGQGRTCNSYSLTEAGRRVVEELRKTITTSGETQIWMNRFV